MRKWKTIKIFISSTFIDMQAERDHLIRFVFPKLREKLLKKKIHLVDIDLRWGITSEQNVVSACRSIIDECRPHFLCLLGGRYGWIPEGQKKSITADEIQYGVFDRMMSKGSAHFYFRDPVSTSQMIESETGQYFEPKGSKNETKLCQLKNTITNLGFKPFVYQAKWDPKLHRLVGLEKLGTQVYSDIMNSINAEMEKKTHPLSSSTEDDELMEAFVAEKVERYFVGSRSKTLMQMHKFAFDSGKPNIFLIKGLSGSGKSALLAKCCQDLLDKGIENQLIIPHFIGISAGSSDLYLTLVRLCQKLMESMETSERLPADLYKLIQKFWELLDRASKKKHVILIIDAINQFDAANTPHLLKWLPDEIGPNVRIILSTMIGRLDDTNTINENPELTHLRARSGQYLEYSLPPLDKNDCLSIVNAYLSKYHKQLSDIQIDALLSKSGAVLPLYLLVVMEELRTLGNYDEITDCIYELPEDLYNLVRWILEIRLPRDPGFTDGKGFLTGPRIVKQLVSYLGASRHGLSQSELTALVDPGDSQGNVSALLRLLRPYLMKRGELMDFYHIQFKEVVDKKILKDKKHKLMIHHHLSQYFMNQADPQNDERWTGNDKRAFNELPYHAFMAELYSLNFKLARSRSFLISQHRNLPDNARINLYTIQKAIQASVNMDDAGKMAEFSLSHADSSIDLSNESPVAALDSGMIEAACDLADLYGYDQSVLWYLYIVLSLMDNGNTVGARMVIEKLMQKPLQPLSETNESVAANWMADISSGFMEATKDLSFSLLSHKGRSWLYSGLIQTGRISLAIDLMRLNNPRILKILFLGLTQKFSWEGLPVESGDLVKARRLLSDLDDTAAQFMILQKITELQVSIDGTEECLISFGKLIELVYQHTGIAKQPQDHLPHRDIAEQIKTGKLSEAVITYTSLLETIAAWHIQNNYDSDLFIEKLFLVFSSILTLHSLIIQKDVLHFSLIKIYNLILEIFTADTPDKIFAIVNTARSLVLLDLREDAVQFFNYASQMADNLSTFEKVNALKKITQTLDLSGFFQMAAGIRSQLHEILIDHQTAYAWYQNWNITIGNDEEIEDAITIIVAIALIEAGFNQDAFSILTKAREEILICDDSPEKCFDLINIARTFSMAGYYDDARKLFAHTGTIIQNLEYDDTIAMYFIDNLAKLNLYDQAFEALYLISSKIPKVLALESIAKYQALSNHRTEALATFQRSVQTNLAYTRPQLHINALKIIAEQQVHTGFLDQANNTLSLAFEKTHEIKEAEARYDALIRISLAQASFSGKCKNMSETLNYMQDSVIDFEEESNKLKALITGVGPLLSRYGKEDQALDTFRRVLDEDMVFLNPEKYLSQVVYELLFFNPAAAEQAFTIFCEKIGQTTDRINHIRLFALFIKGLINSIDNAASIQENNHHLTKKNPVISKIIIESLMRAQHALQNSRINKGWRHFANEMEHAYQITQRTKRQAVLQQLSINHSQIVSNVEKQKQEIEEQIKVFILLAEAQLLADDTDAAMATVAIIYEHIQLFIFEDDRFRQFLQVLETEIHIAVKIAQSPMQSGDENKAKHELQRLSRKLKKFSIDYSVDQTRTAWLLTCIVSAQSQINDLHGAQETIHIIGPPHSDEILIKKIAALNEIAKAELKNANLMKTNQTLTEAKGMVLSIKRAELRTVALLSIAETLREAGHDKSAISTYHKAYQTALTIIDTTERAEALKIITNAYFDLGLEDMILTVIDAELATKQALIFNALQACSAGKSRSLLRKLIPYCVDNIDQCINSFGALAVLYPEQSTAVFQSIYGTIDIEKQILSR